MTVEEIAAKVIEVMKGDGCLDPLPLMLDNCEEEGASRETVMAALLLAVKQLRDEVQALSDHADALLGYIIDRKADPTYADHHLRADERIATFGMLDEQGADGEYE